MTVHVSSGFVTRLVRADETLTRGTARDPGQDLKVLPYHIHTHVLATRTYRVSVHHAFLIVMLACLCHALHVMLSGAAEGEATERIGVT